MTRDFNQETHGDGGVGVGAGGGKKFLYTGSRRKSGFDGEDDIDNREWSFNKSPGLSNGLSNRSERGADFNLDGIWSVKNNIGVSAVKNPSGAKPGVQDGWDRGSQGFYSRHGNVSNGAQENSTMTNGTSADPKNDGESVARVRYPSGKTWPRGHKHYSYTSPSGGQPQYNSGGSAISKDFQPVSPSSRPNLANQSNNAHLVTSPVTVSQGGSLDWRSSGRNGVQRRTYGGKSGTNGMAQSPSAKHFDF